MCINPQNLRVCDLTWLEGLCRHGSVKGLELGDFPGLPNGITGVLLRQRQEGQKKCDDRSRGLSVGVKY